MCIAIYKPQGKALDPDVYRNCFSNNDDGAGFAFINNEKLYIAKGYFTFDDFWEDYKPLEEKASLIHFRVGTSGGQNAENCHPWRINDNLVFVHNGIISIDRKVQSHSDTGNYCSKILQPLTNNYPDWWKRKEFLWIMENALGCNNKVVILDNKGNYQIFNSKAGEWKDDCWFSNISFSYCKGVYRNGCGYGGKGRMAWGEDDDFATDYNTHSHSSTVLSSQGKTPLLQDRQEELVNIDTATIDARLEAAEQKRREQKVK